MRSANRTRILVLSLIRAFPQWAVPVRTWAPEHPGRSGDEGRSCDPIKECDLIPRPGCASIFVATILEQDQLTCPGNSVRMPRAAASRSNARVGAPCCTKVSGQSSGAARPSARASRAMARPTSPSACTASASDSYHVLASSKRSTSLRYLWCQALITLLGLRDRVEGLLSAALRTIPPRAPRVPVMPPSEAARCALRCSSPCAVGMHLLSGALSLRTAEGGVAISS
jgi:hypothetical protein